MTAFLFTAIFRKTDDSRDFEFDHLDDGKPINTKYAGKVIVVCRLPIFYFVTEMIYYFLIIKIAKDQSSA